MTIDTSREYNIYNINEITSFLYCFDRLLRAYNYHLISLQWNNINNFYSKTKEKRIQLRMYKDKIIPIIFWCSFYYFPAESCDDIFICQIDSIDTTYAPSPWKTFSKALLCQPYFLRASKDDLPGIDKGILIREKKYFTYLPPIIYLSLLFIAAVECLDEDVLDIIFKHFIKYIDNHSLTIFSKYIENLINLHCAEKYVDGAKVAWLLNLKNNLSSLLKDNENELAL